MKQANKAILIVLIFLLAWSGSVALARVVVDNPSTNAGDVENSQTVTHTYLLRNVSDKPIKVLETKANCGCTVAKLPDDTIAPGSEIPITVELSLKGKRGLVKQSVVVKTDDPETSQLLLTIEANATYLLDVKPAQIAFGRVLAGEVASRTLELVRNPQVSTPLLITKITASSKAIETELETVEAERAYRLHVRMRPSAPGRISGSIQIETSLSGSTPFVVPVAGHAVGDLTVTPEEIVLTDNGGQPVTRYVLVTPGKVKDFEVTSIEPPVSSVQVDKTTLGSGGIRVQLRNLVAAPELEGKALRLQTNVPSMGQIVIPIRVVRAQPTTQAASQSPSR